MSRPLALAAEVESYRRRWLGVRALKSVSIICLCLSFAILSGLPAYWNLLPLLSVVWWMRKVPDEREVVRRLDVQTGLGGALLCGWDNRSREGAVVEAQYARALDRYLSLRNEPLIPRPNWIWLGPPVALMGVFFLSPAQENLPFKVAPSVATVSNPGESNGQETGQQAVIPESEPERRTRLLGDEQDGNQGTAQGTSPEMGQVQHQAQGVEGTNTEVEPSAVRFEKLSTGGLDETRLDGVAGTVPTQTVGSGRVLVGQTPPPIDAIVDPARPYPRRYHVIINSWFEREKQ